MRKSLGLSSAVFLSRRQIVSGCWYTILGDHGDILLNYFVG